MINFEALFKISYGLYIVSSGNSVKGNGFISNAVFQVTAEPPKFAACCNKDNYTATLIKESKAFSISVLRQDAGADVIGKFGYKSGKDFNKMEGTSFKTGSTGVPVVLDSAIATIECKVVDTFDVGTHLIFIGEVIASEVIDSDTEALTYDYYRKVKKGMAPKNAPTYIDKSKLKKDKPVGKKYKCPACGYIYDEVTGDETVNIQAGTKFEDLPEGWPCPLCGTPKEDFIEV